MSYVFVFLGGAAAYFLFEAYASQRLEPAFRVLMRAQIFVERLFAK